MLTGILEMAMLENIWPTTWKIPIGNVFCMITLVGILRLVKRMMGDMKSRQYVATKPNWMKVRVIG